MLLGEPRPTQGDIHFTLFGFPVRIHPMFWLIAFVFGMAGTPPLPLVFVWVIAVFIAILIHELGHALVMRYYGISPRITLYGMGGLASYNPSQVRDQRAFSTSAQIAISAAGPLAGFLFAALIVVAIISSGNSVEPKFAFPYGPLLIPRGIENPVLFSFLFDLLFISITWGLFNLLPVYPLDGGSISREVCLRLNTKQGIRISLTLSLVTAAGIALLSLANTVRSVGFPGLTSYGNLFIPLLFGYLAYFSYAALQAYNNHNSRY